MRTMGLFENGYISDEIEPGAYLLPSFALQYADEVLSDLDMIVEVSPFRHMMTPGGYVMSVAMTNCGTYGWLTDKFGYRYDPVDPLTRRHWPKMPSSFSELAKSAASQAGYECFEPDSCLINRYEPGSRLTLHQDKNEKCFNHPIVSVSLGLSAIFLFGGLNRSDQTRKLPLNHGDVTVWGGPSRLRYHGIQPLKQGVHVLTGEYRINLTFRKAI